MDIIRSKIGIFVFLFGVTYFSSMQLAAADTYIQIEYFSVGSSNLAMDSRAKIRAIHEQMLENGEIYAWYDYSVRFPTNVEATYDRVIVTVFSDEKFVAARNAQMPDLGILEKTEYAFPDHEMRSPGYETQSSAYTTVNFFSADLDNESLQATMLASWKTALDKNFVDTGIWTAWSKFNMPGVMAAENYNFVIVTRQDNFAMAEKRIVIPDSLAQRVELKKSELWYVNDIITAAPP